MNAPSGYWELNARFTAFAAEQSALPWRDYPKTLNQFASSLVKEAGGRYSLALRQLAAQECLLNARGRPVSRAEFRPAWRRLEELGYARVQERVLMACVFAQWSSDTGELRREAQRGLRLRVRG